MNRIIHRIFIVLLVLVTTPSYASQDYNESLSLRKEYPIQLFMGTCVKGRAQKAAITSQTKEMGFKKATKQRATQYLQGNDGIAWHMENEHGRFGVALLKNGLCSVFIQQGNAIKLKASMEAWLPPEGSGFIYTKESVSESGALSTTAYKIYRGSSLMEQWVITLSSQADSNLRAIMSYDTP